MIHFCHKKYIKKLSTIFPSINSFWYSFNLFIKPDIQVVKILNSKQNWLLEYWNKKAKKIIFYFSIFLSSFIIDGTNSSKFSIIILVVLTPYFHKIGRFFFTKTNLWVFFSIFYKIKGFSFFKLLFILSFKKIIELEKIFRFLFICTKS